MALGWALLLKLPFGAVLIFWCCRTGVDFKKTCFFVGRFQRNRLPFEQISAI
ncbi:MAG: hypothetical protein MST10_01540 [Lentisphaeria bacterium]|nr:hypothetical protein [Lentisphaeria bacterium]